MFISQPNLSGIFIGYDTRFNDAFSKLPSVADKISEVIPCSTSTIALPFLQMFGQVRLWQGDRIPQNYVLQDVQVTPALWELTTEIPRTAIEDDMYGVYASKGADRMARNFKAHADKQLALAIEGSATGFDGVSFFNSAHPIDPSNPASATQSNWYDSTHTGGAAMPLTAANVGVLRAAQMNLQDPGGLPLGITGTILMVPPALEQAALQIANAQFNPETVAGVGATGSNVWQGYFSVVVNPYLTDASAWYLLAVNEGLMPFIWVERTPVELTAITDPQNPLVFLRDSFVIGGRRRGAAACSLYYLAMKARNA